MPNVAIKYLTRTCACANCGKADREKRPRPNCTCFRCSSWAKGIPPDNKPKRPGPSAAQQAKMQENRNRQRAEADGRD